MPRAPDHPDPERLLAEDPFVRGLAQSLLRDAHAADDVAQDALVAAMQAPPPHSLRGFLTTLVRRLCGKHTRGERRRTAREAAAAQAETVPSTATIVAREQLRAEVVRAVLALEPIYRDVVLLRWFDNLPPRAIARRLGVPKETVRTRLKRALLLLRQQLDRHHGRATWGALLLPFVEPAGPLLATATAVEAFTAGALLMTTKYQVAAGAVALAGAMMFALWALQSPPTNLSPPQPAAPAAVEPARGDAGAPAQPATTPEVGAAPERTAAPPLDGATTGALLLHVVWGDDKTPAEDVAYKLFRGGDDELFGQPRARTDADGDARFTGLLPGRVFAELMRPDAGNDGFARAEIVAGQETRVEVTLPLGMTAVGRVVDGGGAPIADAEVLACGWGGGETLPIGRSDADGRFRLRGIATHCHIGARAHGFAASPLRQFTGSEGGTVEFVLVLEQPGAELIGTVLDAEERPVAGAAVAAGRKDNGNIKLPDGASALPPQPQRTYTAADGTFALHSLAVGTVPLAVRAQGLSSWSGPVELRAGPQNRVTVRLLAGVTLLGTVVDADGVALAGMDVDIGDWSALDHRSVSTLEDGSFRIDGLAAGTLKLQVRGRQGQLSRELQASPGETLRCDLALPRGIELRCRVLDADGHGVRAMIEARLQKPRRGEPWWAFENSDDDGHAVLKNCLPDQPIHLSVRRKSLFNELEIDGVVPNGEELVLRLPKEAWVHIRGTVLDPDGKPLANVHVSPFKQGGSGSPAATNDATTGAFDLGPYPPGVYSLHLAADGYPPVSMKNHELGPDEVWEVGTVQMQRPGYGEATLVHPDGKPLDDLTLTIYRADGARGGQIEVQHSRGRSEPLAPGDYVLQVGVEGMACVQVPFPVQAGVTTPLVVILQRGAAVKLLFGLPAGAGTEALTVVVTDARGVVVLRTSCWPRDKVAERKLSLLPGTYRVEASNQHLTGGGDFTVDGAGEHETTVALRRR